MVWGRCGVGLGLVWFGLGVGWGWGRGWGGLGLGGVAGCTPVITANDNHAPLHAPGTCGVAPGCDRDLHTAAWDLHTTGWDVHVLTAAHTPSRRVMMRPLGRRRSIMSIVGLLNRCSHHSSGLHCYCDSLVRLALLQVRSRAARGRERLLRLTMYGAASNSS